MNEDLEAIRVMGFWYWAWCRTGAYRAFMAIGSSFQLASRYRHGTIYGRFDAALVSMVRPALPDASNRLRAAECINV